MDGETTGAAGQTMTGEKRAPGIASGLGYSRYKEYSIPGYAYVVRVHVPIDVWSGVLYSWLSLKGHLQALHDFDRTEFFAAEDAEGDVDAVFVVIFDGAEAMETWIEDGYSTDRMLRGMGLPEADVHVQLMRDIS